MPHQVIDWFEKVAPDYDQVLPFFQEMAEQAAAVLPVGTGTRVLDLGAGTGAFTARALERGARVTVPPDRRAEFRDRLIAEADAAGARTLQATATLWAGTQPREGRPRAR